MKNSKILVNDFIEWKKIITKQYDENLPDKLIFPEEVKEFASGYMIYPIGNIEDKSLIATSMTTDSLENGVEYFKKLSEEYKVFPYQVLWRHIKVSDYTINSYIFLFSTTDKETT